MLYEGCLDALHADEAAEEEGAVAPVFRCLPGPRDLTWGSKDSQMRGQRVPVLPSMALHVDQSGGEEEPRKAKQP